MAAAFANHMTPDFEQLSQKTYGCVRSDEKGYISLTAYLYLILLNLCVKTLVKAV